MGRVSFGASESTPECPSRVSGSETSFRMSHQIVPVQPAQMSYHIDPVENPEAKELKLGLPANRGHVVELPSG